LAVDLDGPFGRVTDAPQVHGPLGVAHLPHAGHALLQPVAERATAGALADPAPELRIPQREERADAPRLVQVLGAVLALAHAHAQELVRARLDEERAVPRPDLVGRYVVDVAGDRAGDLALRVLRVLLERQRADAPVQDDRHRAVGGGADDLREQRR